MRSGEYNFSIIIPTFHHPTSYGFSEYLFEYIIWKNICFSFLTLFLENSQHNWVTMGYSDGQSKVQRGWVKDKLG